jgi:hypothetical protein
MHSNLNLSGQAVGNFFQPPMQIICIKNQAKKQGLTGNTENVKKCPTAPECMMKAYFNYRMQAAVPNYPLGKNFSFFAIEVECY